MSFITLLTDTCTYWVPATPDGFGGLSYSTPTTISVRWEDKEDLHQDFAGEEFISSAIVYTSTELVNNGWLYLGTSAQANPQNQSGAYRIKRRDKTSTPNDSITVFKNIAG
jgi:hypothetical protein